MPDRQPRRTSTPTAQPRRRRDLPSVIALLALVAAACSPTACAPSSPQLLSTPTETVITPPPAPLDVRTLHREAAEEPAPIVSGQSDIPPAELDLHWREIIRPDRVIPGSLSLGTTSEGHLAGATVMPLEGEHHAIIAGCRERETNFGSEELVEVLLHTAREVGQAAPGARLMICNMAFRQGGNLKWSHSHNSGRDADIAFYVLRDGKPVDAPALVTFGADLRSVGVPGLTFDVERNWRQVKALLSHPSVQVQWLFVSIPLKEAMLGWARDHGESPELIARAESVLWQPTDSSPHNDHLHLRIYCSRQDVVEGCINTGPVWSWVDDFEDARRARADALTRGLDDPDEGVRLAILEFLVKIEGELAAPTLAGKALFDEARRVRLRTLDLLATWRPKDASVRANLERFIRAPGGGIVTDDPTFSRTELGPQVAATPEASAALLDAATPEPLHPDPIRDAAMLEAAWRTYGLLADDGAVPFILDALASRRTIGDKPAAARPEPVLAAQAARHLDDPRLVPALIAQLDDPGADVRQAAAETLRRITNHTFKVNWARATDRKRRHRDVERWTAWWSAHRDKPRSTLLLEGFKEAGLKIRDLDSWDTVAALVKATGRDDHVGYNADRVVAAITGRWSPRDSSPAARAGRWKKWWRKNEKRLRKRSRK